MSILLCRFRLGGGMMERLTEMQSAGYDLKELNGEWCNKYCEKQKAQTCRKCGIYQAIQKLAEYEDLEEQGLLLRLPCKIGDTIWDNDCGKPCAYTITGFSFGTGENFIDEPVSLKEIVYYYSNYNGSITGSFAVSIIGETIFLTKAEAEQKLKEMESD